MEYYANMKLREIQFLLSNCFLKWRELTLKSGHILSRARTIYTSDRGAEVELLGTKSITCVLFYRYGFGYEINSYAILSLAKSEHLLLACVSITTFPFRSSLFDDEMMLNKGGSERGGCRFENHLVLCKMHAEYLCSNYPNRTTFYSIPKASCWKNATFLLSRPLCFCTI